MIDLHAHILYGFDDGAKDRDTCCRMLELYAAGKVDTVCASSHSAANIDNRYEEYFARSAELAASFGITLLPALEYALTDLLAHPDKHLGNGKYFLLDTANFPVDNALINKLKPLNSAGNCFLWAHPERLHIADPVKTARNYALLRGSGCQLNGASLLGLFGKEVKIAAWELLESGFCSVISSDAHTTDEVNAWLKVKQQLTAFYPDDMVNFWFDTNPQRIISGLTAERRETPALSLKKRFLRLFQN